MRLMWRELFTRPSSAEAARKTSRHRVGVGALFFKNHKSVPHFHLSILRRLARNAFSSPCCAWQETHCGSFVRAPTCPVYRPFRKARARAGHLGGGGGFGRAVTGDAGLAHALGHGGAFKPGLMTIGAIGAPF